MRRWMGCGLRMPAARMRAKLRNSFSAHTLTILRGLLLQYDLKRKSPLTYLHAKTQPITHPHYVNSKGNRHSMRFMQLECSKQRARMECCKILRYRVIIVLCAQLWEHAADLSRSLKVKIEVL